MVVAGSRSFLGAASLAGIAAARVGAGLVTIAIPESLVSSVAPSAAEPTFLPLPESRRGVVSDAAAGVILDALPAYSALLVGCGLGQEPETARMVERLLLSGADLPPTVVDADGLNTLARIPRWWENWTDRRHPNAASRRNGEIDGGYGVVVGIEAGWIRRWTPPSGGARQSFSRGLIRWLRTRTDPRASRRSPIPRSPRRGRGTFWRARFWGCYRRDQRSDARHRSASICTARRANRYAVGWETRG